MSNPIHTERRQVLRILVAAGAVASTAALSPAARAPQCADDCTPLQFAPKTEPDPNPLENELSKYPTCPYCGMDRRKFHYSRHLVHYQDDLVDATCSLHCTALSLALNLDRGPKTIYAADYGATAEPKPLMDVDKAIYLVGSKLPGVMTKQSKVAFSSRPAAEAVKAAQGGELGNFDAALRAAYLSMASDTGMIRKKRAERRQHAGQAEPGQ